MTEQSRETTGQGDEPASARNADPAPPATPSGSCGSSAHELGERRLTATRANLPPTPSLNAIREL